MNSLHSAYAATLQNDLAHGKHDNTARKLHALAGGYALHYTIIFMCHFLKKWRPLAVSGFKLSAKYGWF
jgi:hypothetical protein